MKEGMSTKSHHPYSSQSINCGNWRGRTGFIGIEQEVYPNQCRSIVLSIRDSSF